MHGLEPLLHSPELLHSSALSPTPPSDPGEPRASSVTRTRRRRSLLVDAGRPSEHARVAIDTGSSARSSRSSSRAAAPPPHRPCVAAVHGPTTVSPPSRCCGSTAAAPPFLRRRGDACTCMCPPRVWAANRLSPGNSKNRVPAGHRTRASYGAGPDLAKPRDLGPLLSSPLFLD
jgi:hypothetical protein